MTTTENKRLSDTDQKAVVQLIELLKIAGGNWATEQQWRTWADRREIAPVKASDEDRRARGFLINNLIEAGLVEQSEAVFHARRPGQNPTSLPIYRPV